VTSQPRAFFALDFGSATTSAAVLGHVGGRWRLIAHTAAPSYFDIDAMLAGLLAKAGATDPEMLAQIGAEQGADIPTLVATWPRLIARTTPQRRIAVLAGSRRQRRRLETAALRAGWTVVGGSADEDDAVVLSRLLLSTETHAVLLGADHVPAGDEKRHLPDLAALVAAATRSRPELTVVLAGGAAAFEGEFAAVADSLSSGDAISSAGDPEPDTVEEAPVLEPSADEAPPQTKKISKKAAAALETGAPDEPQEVGRAPEPTPDRAIVEPPAEPAPAEPAPAEAAPAASATAPAAEPNPTITAPASSQPTPLQLAFHVATAPEAVTHILLAPDAEAGQLPGDALQQVLEGLRTLPNDSRIGVARSIASLAYVLDRSIEVAEIGLQGGLISRSDPFGQGHFTVASSHACLAAGSFAPVSPSEEVIDGVLSWSTVALDRHRAMDRLNDLRLVPWGEADGDGAIFRLAAAKAAFGRLIDAMPELAAHEMPELLVAAGGVFASMPPSVVALALADLVRRPGVSQMTYDQARVLGPLGAIEDEDERRTLLANLADDILVPLGALILPSGIKPGKSAGYLRLKGASNVAEIELHPGAVQVVDLPPGIGARADLDFRDTVRLGKRARHFTVDVGGGLSGLLVDLRDIPMRISDRPDSRRAALETWQRGMWPEVDE
jgi:hypothetical protein